MATTTDPIEEIKARIEEVDPAAAQSEVADGAILIDTREPHEYQICNIPTAKLIPLGELAGRAGELSRERPVVAVCRAGGRSAQATVILQQAGFRDVANLAGGMLRWRAEGCAVEGGVVLPSGVEADTYVI